MRTLVLAGLLVVAACAGTCADDAKPQPGGGERIKVADIKITFAAKQVAPAEDIPKEARSAGITPEGGGHDPSVQISFGVVKDPSDHGPLAKLVDERIAAVKVTWADLKRFKSETQTEDFLRARLGSSHGSSFTFQAWSQALGVPMLAADVEHAGGKPGQLLIWPSGDDAALCVYRDGASTWWFGTWEKLSEDRLAARGNRSAVYGPAVSTKSSETEISELIRAISRKIEEQVPELVCKHIATEIPTSSRVWNGEENAAAGFVRAENAAADPRDLAKRGLPYEALSITLARYASPADAQKDIERSLRERPAMTPPKETYKRASLYRYESGGGNVIFQFDSYVVELSPLDSGLGQSAVTKALDAVLEEIDAAKSKQARP